MREDINILVCVFFVGIMFAEENEKKCDDVVSFRVFVLFFRNLHTYTRACMISRLEMIYEHVALKERYCLRPKTTFLTLMK
jgi:hypothetical protein